MNREKISEMLIYMISGLIICFIAVFRYVDRMDLVVVYVDMWILYVFWTTILIISFGALLIGLGIAELISECVMNEKR